MNLSPATGTSFNPVISTGVAGKASLITFPRSSNIWRTRPWAVPTTIGSPALKVPFSTNNVATGPRPRSSFPSTTLPYA